MLSLILFILVGIKLNIMNGLYLALIIIYAIMDIIGLFVKIIQFGLKMYKGE